ncbi:MAG: hypothetical protein JWQ98_1360 [Chlorobi bacterium]|nr:hypothetical protein [Chlorobiota bacterium]
MPKFAYYVDKNDKLKELPLFDSHPVSSAIIILISDCAIITIKQMNFRTLSPAGASC